MLLFFHVQYVEGAVRLRTRLALPIVVAVLFFTANVMAQLPSATPKRDINAVLADHDDRLLAIPGVVGVYVGLLEDGRTSCLKVMLARKTPEAGRDIPKTLEGYSVVTEVTGEIRPLK